jgi:flagellar M-ring protein FliF
MAKLKAAWNTAMEKLNKMSLTSRRLMAGGALTLVLFFVFYASILGKVNYVVLFSGLELNSAAAIVEEMDRLGTVKYKLEDDGATILVDEAVVSDLRLKLAMNGSLPDNTVGFELFDNQGLMVTDQDRKIMFQRATQGELERTIRALEEVKYARVHLNLAESTLFEKEVEQSSATVVLELAPGKTLSLPQVEGILSLVSGAVKNLPKENVTVLDTNANLLSGPFQEEEADGTLNASGEQNDIIDRIESKIAGNLTELLEKALGREKVIVTVLAEVNFDQEQISKVIYGETPVVKNRQESFSGEGIKAFISEGPIDNNTQNLIMQDDTGAIQTYDAYTEYEVDRTEIASIKAVGVLSRLNVSVVYDGKLSPEMKASIQDMVSAAAGIDPERGDQINIEGMTFDRSYETALAEELEEARRLEEAAGKMMGMDKALLLTLVKWALGLAAGVLLLAIVMRKRRQGGHSVMTPAFEGAPSNIPGRGSLLNVTDEGAASQEPTLDDLFGAVDKKDSSLKKYASEHPQEIADLIRAWIKEQ